MRFSLRSFSIDITVRRQTLQRALAFFSKYELPILFLVVALISIGSFLFFYGNGTGVAYNDARSHLNMGRRVVDGLKPGFAQLGSVWLPLPHILMVPTIWVDFMWHTGLSGAIVSMAAFTLTSVLIYRFLQKIGVGAFGRIAGVGIFVTNLNILYLQSTAMTELLLLATMTAGVYFLMLWYRNTHVVNLVKAAFFIMLATLTRYDGWFLFAFASFLVLLQTFRRQFKSIEGTAIMFCTLGGFGIFLWLLWNQMIFGNPLYFAFGPYSAHAQQDVLEANGDLPTKGNLSLSVTTYFLALAYNAGIFPLVLSIIGCIMLFKDKKISRDTRIAFTALLTPLAFNIISLVVGHSALRIEGLTGGSWFNVRYGVMMMPAIAVFIGYMLDKTIFLRTSLIGLLAFTIVFSFTSYDIVTLEDALRGASSRNVTEVSAWLRDNTEEDGFILLSLGSHDATLFTSGLPMTKFVYEGTDEYWEAALKEPERVARWIVMRPNDDSDFVGKSLRKEPSLQKYRVAVSFPDTNIYELKPEYVHELRKSPFTMSHGHPVR